MPAGGVAVLYPGSDLGYAPERFTSAWGSSVHLIPVVGFTSLTATDAIGLWPSQSAHAADALPGTTAPRRTFASASATVNNVADLANPGVKPAGRRPRGC